MVIYLLNVKTRSLFEGTVQFCEYLMWSSVNQYFKAVIVHCSWRLSEYSAKFYLSWAKMRKCMGQNCITWHIMKSYVELMHQSVL